MASNVSCQSKFQLICGVWSSLRRPHSLLTFGHSCSSTWIKWKRLFPLFSLNLLMYPTLRWSTSLRTDFSLRMNEGVAATPYSAVPIKKKCGKLNCFTWNLGGGGGELVTVTTVVCYCWWLVNWKRPYKNIIYLTKGGGGETDGGV